MTVFTVQHATGKVLTASVNEAVLTKVLFTIEKRYLSMDHEWQAMNNKD